MTTIAWDGRYLAADTRETWDKSIPTFSRKIEILDPEVIMAYCGSSYVYSHIKDFFLGRTTKLAKEAKASEAIVIVKGKPYNWQGTELDGLVQIYSPPHAIGSGWKYAWAYMRLGYSAMDAINMTSQMDIWTNDVVDYYDTKTKKLHLAPFPTNRIQLPAIPV